MLVDDLVSLVGVLGEFGEGYIVLVVDDVVELKVVLILLVVCVCGLVVIWCLLVYLYGVRDLFEVKVL